MSNYDWNAEQLEVIDSYGPENRWKFHYETAAEFQIT